MARKTPVNPVPPEQSPEYLAMVAALPDDRDALDDKARELLSVRHDAMLAADDVALARADFLYNAITTKLNGGTSFGSAVERDRLRALFAAAPGHVPTWGRMGEFLLEVDGLRLVVEFKPYALAGHFELAVHAVDLHKPFISRTGYTHRYVVVGAHLGRSVVEAARLEVLKLRAETGLVSIDSAHEGAEPLAVRWPWLARVLACSSDDGQLAMFGDAPAAKVPLSNADRQRALRKRRADQQLKPVMLSESERHLMDKIRAMFEGAPGVGKSQEFVGTLGQANGDFHFLDSGCDVDLRSVWKSLETDFSRMAVALGLLRLRNNQHAELGRAVALLQARLRAAGLSDQISNDQKPWYWNKCPPLDYRASSAAEYMERGSQARTVDDQLYHCRRSLEQAEAEIEQLKAEARKRFEVNFVLRCRLRNAGLSESGEAEPGE